MSISMNTALSNANSGLANINAQLALLSQNVANANTPSYAVESISQQALTAGGMGLGVHTGLATVAIDQALQASVLQQNATVAGLQTTQTALQAIDPVLGTPGQGNDLGSLVGNLQNSFTTLLTDPSSQPQQSAVVATATILAQGINGLSNAYTAQIQAAGDNLGTEVATLNSTLSDIGSINRQIVAAQANNQGTADLVNQRSAALQALSPLLDIKTQAQADGSIIIFTPNGLVLPTTPGASNFSFTSGSVTLDGTDVSAEMAGGQIGANLALRNTALPTDQAELDEFAQTLSSRFAAQGLTLFSDAGGNVPSGGGTPVQSGYVGYAAAIQVNPAVIANPALVRDGTGAIAASADGASAFTPNPPGGPAGFSDLISRVLDYTFTDQAQAGVSQPSWNTTGLGASGILNAPLDPSGSLSDYAAGLVAAQAQDSAAATSGLTTATALQTSLNAKVSSESGVSIDAEMSQMLVLQNAYSANARVMNAIQSMFTQLLDAVQ